MHSPGSAVIAQPAVIARADIVARAVGPNASSVADACARQPRAHINRVARPRAIEPRPDDVACTALVSGAGGARSLASRPELHGAFLLCAVIVRPAAL